MFELTGRLLVSVVLISSSPAWAATFTVTEGLDGASTFTPRAISDDGSAVVGTGASTPGQQAIRWDAVNGAQGLGDLSGGAYLSSANGVSGDGTIAVGYSVSSSGNEAFIWDSVSGMQAIGDLPGGFFSSHGWGISADGSTVVGRGNSASGFEAFVWTSTTGLQGLGDLPGGAFDSRANAVSADGTKVVGTGESSVGLEGFVWDATNGMVGLGGLPGGDGQSVTSQISPDGTYIVGNSDGPSGLEAFLWDPVNGMQGLGIPSGCLDSHASGVSADGSVVIGYCSLAPLGDESMALIWDATNGFRSLHSVLTDLGIDLSGRSLQTARAISGDGTRIAGVAADSPFASPTYGFVADLSAPTVPALGTAGSWLLAAGLGCVGLRGVARRADSRRG